MTIVEFLEARIAEDEEVARAAIKDDGLIRAAVNADKAAQGRAADVAHIARWAPARVLAECAAKRRIVEAHPIEGGSLGGFTDCGTCLDVDTYDAYPCLTLRLLAEIDADHPDFQEVWRP